MNAKRAFLIAAMAMSLFVVPSAGQEPGLGSVPDITDLAPLVATYGVYAIALIFILFMWRRSAADVASANPKSEKLFAKIHIIVVSTTIGLALVATGIWFYASFIHKPVNVARGLITGLTQQVALPPEPGGKPHVYQVVNIDTMPEVDAYSLMMTPKPSSPEYQLKWILVSRDSLETASFHLLHSYEALVVDNSPRLVPGAPPVKPIRKTDEKRFVLNLSQNSGVLGVIYELDHSSPESAGHVYLQTRKSAREQIPWVANSETSPIRPGPTQPINALIRLLSPSVFAQTKKQDQGPFNFDGSIDPRTAAVLRQRLGSSDIRAQMATRVLLVQAGEKAFKFIIESLEIKQEYGVDRALLVHNLAAVVTEDEKSGTQFPKPGHLKMAQAFYALGDYSMAATFFDKAGNVLKTSSDFLMRGYVFQQAGQEKRAIADYQDALAAADTPFIKAASHTALGTLHLDAGRNGEADSEFNAALKLDASSGMALNNLAYSYAQRSIKLEEGLALVNRALKDSPDAADFLDTKGWILVKLGKFAEAVPILERAWSLAPNDQEIMGHLKEARAAVAAKKTGT